MKTADHAEPPVAYSYIRFSHPDQAKGDSLRRQTEAAVHWCERNSVRLDTSTTFRDLGKSAYTGQHRTNPDRNALAAFLKLVEAGKVPRGSYIILENLDRLTREDIQPALLLALNLLQAGIRIVQLSPAEMVFDDKSDTLPVMMMMMELSRGHGESAIKSERVGAAWAQRRKNARDGRDVLTHRLPAWVEERCGRLELIPARAAVVRRIFEMAAGGYGHASIVKRFTEEQVSPFGQAVVRPGKRRPAFSGQWTRSYIATILKDRRAIGELQPRKRDGKPDGDVIPNYFPAVVSEEEWYAARAGAAQRRQKPGRVGKHVNVFAGLLRNARDGDSYYVATRTDGHKPGRRGGTHRVLINTGAAEGRTPCYSFPFNSFEKAILSLLVEVDPREVLGQDDGPDEVLTLSGELAQTEAKIAELEAELLKGDVAALAKVLRQLEEQKRQLAEKLTGARQKAAHPLSEAWGWARPLMTALDTAPDPEDARLRLRGALRRVVEGIWLLVVPRGRARLAAVQVWFTDDGHRDYLVLHEPPKSNGKSRQEGHWKTWTLADVAAPGELDLRRPEHAELLETKLLTVNTADLLAAVR
jgi:DNA invertase Pin-like site-specific DNA recombinase